MACFAVVALQILKTSPRRLLCDGLEYWTTYSKLKMRDTVLLLRTEASRFLEVPSHGSPAPIGDQDAIPASIGELFDWAELMSWLGFCVELKKYRLRVCFAVKRIEDCRREPDEIAKSSDCWCPPVKLYSQIPYHPSPLSTAQSWLVLGRLMQSLGEGAIS